MRKTAKQIGAEIVKLEKEFDEAERLDIAASEAVISSDKAEAKAILECAKAREMSLASSRRKHLTSKVYNQINYALARLDEQLRKATE